MARRRRGRRVERRVRSEPAFVVLPPSVIGMHRRRNLEVRAALYRERIRRRVIAVHRLSARTGVFPTAASLRRLVGRGVVVKREQKAVGKKHPKCVRAKSVRRHQFFKAGGGSPRTDRVRREHPC